MPPACTLLCRGELCQVVPLGVEMALSSNGVLFQAGGVRVGLDMEYLRVLCKLEPNIGVDMALYCQCVLCQVGSVRAG